MTTPALPTSPTTTTHRVPDKLVAGDILLKLAAVDDKTLSRAWHGDARAQKLIKSEEARLAQVVPGLHYMRKLPAGWALFKAPIDDEDRTQLAVDRLAKEKGVAGAAVNRWFRALRTPNDEFFSFMWHLDAISARQGWDITTGGAGQTVAVVDTGTILNHEDLVGKDAAGFDFVNDPNASNDGDGRDSNYNDPGDGCGQAQPSFHGTHVAGTILANADNGIGISGINWEARLITVRVLGCGGGNDVDIMEGLAWLAGFEIPLDGNVDLNQNPNAPTVPPLPTNLKPRVANLSLGGAGACDQFSADVTAAVIGQGVLPIIAAGNDGAAVNSPGNCPGVLTVAAYGAESDKPLTSYSSFGAEVSVVAPGGDAFDTGNFQDDVLSCASTTAVNAGDPPYIFEEGTSMATPHVTGVVSLMLDLDPTLTRDDIVSIFNQTGDVCRGCAGKPGLNAAAALALVANLPPPVGEGEGEGEGEGDVGEGEGEIDPHGNPGACDPDRGNMDCPNGQGCRIDGSGAGVCVVGADDGAPEGSLCHDGGDCETGLCDRGVCTVTCDLHPQGCVAGYTCDAEAVPGGLCVAESCHEDPSICGARNCSFSDDGHYVCAVGASNYFCSHTSVEPTSTSTAAGVAAVALLGVMISRRRAPRYARRP